MISDYFAVRRNYANAIQISPFGEIGETIMIIRTPKEFGAALRAQRKKLHYTQAALAEFTGFSVSFLSDLENGKETVELGKVMYLANLLGMDVTLQNRGEV